jgi:hypothetical protein
VRTHACEQIVHGPLATGGSGHTALVPFDRRCIRNFKLTRKWRTFARLQCGVCASAPAGRCNCAQLRVTAHARRFQPQPQAHRSLVTRAPRAGAPGRAGLQLARARWLHVGAGLATAAQWPRLVHGEPSQPQPRFIRVRLGCSESRSAPTSSFDMIAK